jgi:hypothetical protein
MTTAYFGIRAASNTAQSSLNTNNRDRDRDREREQGPA